jgi:hypothetical protein
MASPAVQPLTTASYQTAQDVYYITAAPPEVSVSPQQPPIGYAILAAMDLINAFGAAAAPGTGAGYEMVMPPGQAGLGAASSGRGAPVEVPQAGLTSPYQVRIDPKTGRGPMGIDTSGFASGESTPAGGVRNARAFWGAWAREYPDTLGSGNRDLMKEGLSPVVDDIWVQYFPEHAPYMGETLIHHHLGQGPIAIPLPDSVHRNVPGFEIWHAK